MEIKNNRDESGKTRTITYSYDNNSNLTGYTISKGQQQRLGITYQYDPAGNRTEMDIMGNLTKHQEFNFNQVLPEEKTIYTYNNAEQLTQQENEKVINTQRKTRTIPISTTNYTYDANRNMVTKQIQVSSPFSGEDRGEGDNHHLGSFTTTYQYDYNNLLTEIQFPNNRTEIFRNCSCGTKRVYKKDEEGRVSRYFFDTINGLSQVLITYNKENQPKKIYEYGNTTDQPISMEYRSDQEGEGQGQWRTAYYLYDGQGNVRQLVNSRGQIIATYNYLPFGEMMNRGQGMGITLGRLQNWGRENELGNTITYQGREYDRDSGLYYFRARYQNPTLGRFLEVDPILREVPNYTTGNSWPTSGNSGCGCCGNTANQNNNNNLMNVYSPTNIIFTPAYIFVNNNPVNLRDPSGLFCWAQTIAFTKCILRDTLSEIIEHKEEGEYWFTFCNICWATGGLDLQACAVCATGVIAGGVIAASKISECKQEASHVPCHPPPPSKCPSGGGSGTGGSAGSGSSGTGGYYIPPLKE